MVVARVAIVCSLALAARGGELPKGDDLKRAVKALCETERPDRSPLHGPTLRAIELLGEEERAQFAQQFLASPHWCARSVGASVLERLPTRLAVEPFRRLLKDEAKELRRRAAFYLAREHINDPDARTFLIEEALSRDPRASLDPIMLLGRLKSPDVRRFFVKLLSDRELPMRVLTFALHSAAEAEAFECAPLLVAMLNDRRVMTAEGEREWRVCDAAAAALERLYGINHTGYVAFPTSRKERDEWIALWKRWFEAEGKLPPEAIRANYALRLMDETLRQLEASPGSDVRQRIKKRLVDGLGTAFCLGDLPGVDAVAGPEVRDTFRILRTHDPKDWHKFRNSWESHQYVYEEQFLKKARNAFHEPDRQAFEFIRFANGTPNFPRVRVWAFCRNLIQAFPRSAHLADIREIQQQAADEVKADKNQIVLHGRIAVLEPLPGLAPKGTNMVPVYDQYLSQRVRQVPSNWALHRAFVDYMAASRRQGEVTGADYQGFRDLAMLYPGNEWPFLANAIYQLRVRANPKRALEFADKALALNPGNAKAYAIRGMIRVRTKDSALADLTQAFQLDPRSLADEPETAEAIAHLIAKTREAGKNREADAMQRTLGDLPALKLKHPIPEYQSLLGEGN